MEIGTEEMESDSLKLATKTFAARYARLCFLRRRCNDDHPVLITEVQLVEIARTKLREQLLIRYGSVGMQSRELKISVVIKSMARRCIESTLDDEFERDQVLELIESGDLSEVFRVIN